MDINGMVCANSFAVIGASREENKVGHVIFKNLISHGLKAFPINPSADNVLGYKSYKNLLSLHEKVDCAIIAIPAKAVLSAMKEVITSRIKNIVIISAGFSESGNSRLSEELKKMCEKNQINLLGPNTFGFINPYNKVNASFSEIMPEPGKIAFISQSGAIGAAILDKRIKLSGFISLGNSLITDFSDFIDYYSEDKNTEVITLYVESLKAGCGKKFIDSCKKCKKPIIALKSGKTEKGGKAALSHTAALASPEGVYESIFRQCGIIEADSIRELFQIADTYVKIKKPGKRAGIVTNAGGPGVLCTDYSLKNGIEIPELPERLLKKINEILPDGWSHNNPIDVLGDSKADRYEKVVEILNKENFCDFIMILLTPQQMTEPEKTADSIIGLNPEKPVIFCFIGGTRVYWPINKIKDKYAVFDELDDMIKVLGKIIN